MDRKKRRLLIGGTSIAVLAGLVFYASAEPEEQPRPRQKSLEQERIEGLVDLMSVNSTAMPESTTPAPPPWTPAPMPEGEAFDIGAAVTRHRRSAEAADAAGYLDCDGDCANQGVGITMDGSPAPIPGDELGVSDIGGGRGRTRVPLPEQSEYPSGTSDPRQ